MHSLYIGIVSDVYLVYTNIQQGDEVYRKERLQSNLDSAGDSALSPKHLTNKFWHEHEVGELSPSFPWGCPQRGNLCPDCGSST